MGFPSRTGITSSKTALFLQKYLQAQLLFQGTLREAGEQDIKNKSWNSLCKGRRNNFVSKFSLAGIFFFRETLNWSVLSILTFYILSMVSKIKSIVSRALEPALSFTEQWKQWELCGMGPGVVVIACRPSPWETHPHLWGPSAIAGAVRFRE